MNLEYKVNNKLINIGILAVVLTVFLGLVFFAPKAEANSVYTPFGGKIEKYIPQSNAECVTGACDRINAPIHKAVKAAIAGPRDAFCATVVAPLCSAIPIVGNAACFLACQESINKSIKDSINICQVQEIQVGPPLPASLGILDIGSIEIEPTITIPIPILPDITIPIPGISFSLPNLIPGILDFIPDAKIYNHKEYKTAGVWSIGTSLNIRNLCGGENGGGGLCGGIIVRTLIDVLLGDQGSVGDRAHDAAIAGGKSEADALLAKKDAESEYENSCPLLNLLHQVGTSRGLR